MGDWIKPDVAFKEQYTSAALNRKLAGVLPVGVHWGFHVAPAASGVRMIKIYPGDYPDYPKNIVVFEREGYSITGNADGEYLVEIPAGFDGYLVLEAYYEIGANSQITVRLVETPEVHHVILAKLKVPADAQVITTAMIDYEPRMEANIALLLSQLTTIISGYALMVLNLSARTTLLEQWAETLGYEIPDLAKEES